jgi:hypothetical protein
MGHPIISPEEKQTLDDAAKKAQQDPAVKAARDKMDAAMKDIGKAMVAKDSSLASLVDKVEAAAVPGASPASLSPQERQKLRGGREAVKGTPEDDAWMAAAKDYRIALQQKMITDPAVAAIFEKLRRGPGPGPMPAMPKPSSSPQ